MTWIVYSTYVEDRHCTSYPIVIMDSRPAEHVTALLPWYFFYSITAHREDGMAWLNIYMNYSSTPNSVTGVTWLIFNNLNLTRLLFLIFCAYV